jgi:hypothetical protein
MTPPPPPFPALVAIAALALLTTGTGCETTAQKSARIGEELGPVKQEKGLRITSPTKDVKVVAATVLSDREGAAVVVEVRNSSGTALADVPIAIDVLDAAGKSVYANDLPGLETALTAIPYVPANGTAIWVNDQVLATGTPQDAKVTVGAGGTRVDGPVPKFTATEPKLEGDPYSGVVAGGNVENESGEKNDRVLIYAVARQGGKVVAAGRGAIEKVKQERKPLPYNVYFIGDPRGAAVEISLFPTLPGAKEG